MNRLRVLSVFSLAALLLMSVVLAGCSETESARSADPDADAEAAPRFSVLIFSKTNGFRHASIPDGVRAIRRLGEEHNFAVEATEDSTAFTEGNLARFEAVVFLSTTGDVLNASQQAVFENYIQDGGGFAGIHAAADTEYDWPWYGRLVGAYFESHPNDPNVREATVRVEDTTHASTRMLPQAWTRTDEWYNYRSNPREAGVQVLAVLDESTYEGGAMPDDHPIAWRHAFDGGRAWYTGGGHTKESFSERLFLEHLRGGIEWAAGAL